MRNVLHSKSKSCSINEWISLSALCNMVTIQLFIIWCWAEHSKAEHCRKKKRRIKLVYMVHYISERSKLRGYLTKKHSFFLCNRFKGCFTLKFTFLRQFSFVEMTDEMLILMQTPFLTQPRFLLLLLLCFGCWLFVVYPEGNKNVVL